MHRCRNDIEPISIPSSLSIWDNGFMTDQGTVLKKTKFALILNIPTPLDYSLLRAIMANMCV